MKKVFLWTAPRCISTAFERSVYEIENSKIIHEPYNDAYYFGPDRQSFRFTQTPELITTYEKTTQHIYDCTKRCELFFAKDMAYYMKNHLDIILDERLSDFQHTFLIRNPKKSIISYYRGHLEPNIASFDTENFDTSECGFKELFELYTFVKEQFGIEPIVIDADDLLLNPKDVMKAYCEATGIRFYDDMLTWEPGRIDIWTKWHGWRESLEKSSGFKAMSKEKLNAPMDLSIYPEKVQIAVEENMVYYKKMFECKLDIQL